MILFRMMRRDARRSRGTLTIVFAFIFLATLLMAGGVGLVTTLGGALDALFTAADVPDVVQMHAGEIDKAAIDTWASSHPLVTRYQTTEMLTIESDSLYLGRSGISEKESVMDISFVQPNRDFDLLLNEKNEVFLPERGEIGVPVYYMDRSDLSIGDTVTLSLPNETQVFTIAAFIRDAQMNPSIIHSKRFVIHPGDYEALRERIAETEYLITFQISGDEQIDEFISDYQASGLPQRGPIVDKTIFRTLNALSDGIIAAVTIVLSLVLMVIAILCLRLTILASIEEDYRQIGVMKAIGMKNAHIRRITMAKYLGISLIATTIGYLLSYPLASIPAEDITASFGSAVPRPSMAIAPAVAAIGVFAIINIACTLILRRIARISPVAALRGEGKGRSQRRKTSSVKRRGNININLGLHDLRTRPHLFLLLGFIFIFAAATIIIPVHFYSTITSPSFISYMGIGRSDIRIDLRQTEDTGARYGEMVEYLKNDPDVSRFAPLVTAQYVTVQPTGETETIAIETGDVSLFPLDYLDGRAPIEESEIALSYLHAQDMGLTIGDTLTLRIDGEDNRFVVSGIYQDVTNGGRTAKGRLSYAPENVLWYSVSIDLVEGTAIGVKKDDYTQRFAPARVTDIDGYISQTMGTTIDRVGMVTLVAILLGLGISALITSLFLQMLIRKDRQRIAIQRSIGFSLAHIRTQYLTLTLTVLAIGIGIGTVLSNTLGREIVGFLWSFMGASNISFVVEPLKTYLALPVLFATVVAGTTGITTSQLSKTPGGIQ